MLLYVRNITLFTYILLFDKVYKIETQSGSSSILWYNNVNKCYMYYAVAVNCCLIIAVTRNKIVLFVSIAVA